MGQKRDACSEAQHLISVSHDVIGVDGAADQRV